MYKISIIIPVYNAGKYLDECIESLKKQTIGFENLQVIMADDCSTDNSREKMNIYAQQYKNIRCVYLKENSGAAGRPRNEAIKLADAEYLMFLDPDDIYFENACEGLLHTMEQTKADLVSGYFTTFDDTNGILEENVFAERGIAEKIYHMPEEIGSIAKFKNAFSCKIYKKEVIQKEGIFFPEKIIGQDSVFMWNYLFHIKTVYYVSLPVLGYRQRKEGDTSVSFTLTQKHFEDIEESMGLIREMFLEYGMGDKMEYAFGDVNAYYINQMLDSSLSKDVLMDIFKRWEWLLMAADYDEKKDTFTEIVMCDVRRKDMQKAADKIILLREQKRYLHELETAKDWWHRQSEGKDEQIRELKKARDWWRGQSEGRDKQIEELEAARDWWHGQSEGRDKQIEELKAARDWWHGQSDARDEEIKNYQNIERELKKQVQELAGRPI